MDDDLESEDLDQEVLGQLKAWNDDPASYEQLLIEKADAGDVDSGKEILRILIHRIISEEFDSDVFFYLAKCLMQYEDGVPLERALGVEEQDQSQGGRPYKYNYCQIAAVDIVLRRYAGFKPSKALTWIKNNIGIDKGDVRKRIRPKFDSEFAENADGPLMDALSLKVLLVYTGKLRSELWNLLPANTVNQLLNNNK